MSRASSRAQILKKATEYIQFMRRKNVTHQEDIDDLKKQNVLLEQQIRALERAKSDAGVNASGKEMETLLEAYLKPDNLCHAQATLNSYQIT
jgi:Max protein